MMNAHDDRAPTVVALDEIELPQWSAGIERRGDELAHQRLELGLARTMRHLRARHMQRQVECGIGLPEASSRRFHCALSEAIETKEVLLDGGAKASQSNPLAQDEHPADHHEIARAIHTQPGGIYARHAFALVLWGGIAHCRLLGPRESRESSTEACRRRRESSDGEASLQETPRRPHRRTHDGRHRAT